MKNSPRFVLIGLVILVASALRSEEICSAEKSAKLAPVRIGYVSRSILDMPFIIARDRGYFREEVWSPSSFSSKRLKPYRRC